MELNNLPYKPRWQPHLQAIKRSFGYWIPRIKVVLGFLNQILPGQWSSRVVKGQSEIVAKQKKTVRMFVWKGSIQAKKEDIYIYYIIYYILYIIYYILYILYYMLYVICYMLYIIYYILYVICYILHIIYYILYVICYMLYIIYMYIYVYIYVYIDLGKWEKDSYTWI